MKYDLWDIEARYFFDRYDSEDEALRVVSALLDERGDGYAGDLELVVGEGGHENLTGAALIQRARSVVGADRRASERTERVDSESAANGVAIGAKATARTPR